jgi:single-stranded-DNA-specific exonuclease
MKSNTKIKHWEKEEIDERLVYRYINDFGISDITARLLLARKVEYEEVESYLDPKLKNILPDPFHLIDMDKACEVSYHTISKNEKITIFGDYDVDGATSSALLKRMFRMLGIDVNIYIPDRETEGYGPSEQAMEKFKKNGTSLVIMVDCGIMGHDAINKASNLGIKTIILDHHISTADLPNANAVVNPNRIDESTKHTNLAAVGVCFLFAVAFLKYLREKNFFASIKEPNLLELLDLVALGTVCDMMSLKGLNRAFVKQGLKVMSRRANVGIKALSDISSIDSELSTYHLGFIIGPRINAGGRVGESYLGASILSETIEENAINYASQLNQFNEERKIIERQVIEEALEQAQEKLHMDFLVLSGKNWHQGVIGIAAGKIKDKFLKPVAVIAALDNECKASCRSIKGVDLGCAIALAKENGLVISGGGHSMAAGFSVEQEKIEDLEIFLNNFAIKQISAINHNQIHKYDIEITSRAVNMDLAKELQALEPYGMGNPEPIVKISGLFVLKATQTQGKHISCILAPDKSSYGTNAIRSIAFNSMDTHISDILFSEKAIKIDVIGNIKINNWQGKSSAQLNIIDVLTSE